MARSVIGLGVGCPVVAPVEEGVGEGGGFGGVEVGGEAGEGDGVEALCDLGIVGDDQATGGAAEGFVGAHRHQMRAFGEGLAQTSGDDPALVGGVEGPSRRPDRRSCGPRRRDAEEVQAAADGDDLRADGVGQVF